MKKDFIPEGGRGEAQAGELDGITGESCFEMAV